MWRGSVSMRGERGTRNGGVQRMRRSRENVFSGPLPLSISMKRLARGTAVCSFHSLGQLVVQPLLVVGDARITYLPHVLLYARAA